MSYTKQTWRDQESGGTPITADRLNHMEAGIGGANDAWDSISHFKRLSYNVVATVNPYGWAPCVPLADIARAVGVTTIADMTHMVVSVSTGDSMAYHSWFTTDTQEGSLGCWVGTTNREVRIILTIIYCYD